MGVFFEPIALGNLNAKELHYRPNQSINLVSGGYRLPREHVGKLLEKYVFLKPELEEEIEDLVETMFKGHYVVGVHHRGTDKKYETKLVPYAETLKVLEELIETLPQISVDNLRIFVATDEQAFLNKLLALYPDKVIHNDFVRSTNKFPLHYSNDKYGSNYQKGKEAIIDCFMLSRCNYLIYPATSSFSYFSTRLNPKLLYHAIFPKSG